MNPTHPWPIADLEIQHLIEQALRDHTWGLYHGEHVSAFETELASEFQVTHALTCSSGTMAMETSLKILGVGQGDEVVMAAYDYEASFLSIHELGAMPVLVDVDAKSGQLDVESIPQAVTAKTKAIIASHLHGGLVNMPRLRELANGIPIIEDAAQCPGGRLTLATERQAFPVAPKNVALGSFGDLGILSFGGSKLLSAGRGGAILTSDAKLHQRGKRLLHRGIQAIAPLSELQAIVLRPQLGRLKQDTQKRLDAVKALTEKVPLVPFADFSQTPAFYKVGFWYDAEKMGVSREEYCHAMRQQGVPIDPGFTALHIGRSPSRFRAATPLVNAQRMNDQCVILHHTGLITKSV